MSGTNALAIVAVMAIVVIAVFLMLQFFAPAMGFQSPFNFSINIPGLLNWSAQPPPGSTIDLCNTMLSTFPIYMGQAQSICVVGNGQWVCEADKTGCYNIPTWNTTACTTAEAFAMKAFCASIGGKWTCQINEVSCEV